MELFSQWSDALSAAFTQLLTRLALFVPNVLGAVLLLAVGWLVARILRAIALRLALLAERALARLQTRRGGGGVRLSGASVRIFGSIVFWLVLLFFLTAATEVLGLDAFTAWLAKVVDYVPTLLAGGLIIVAGFLVSRLAREVVMAAAAGAGERQRELAGQVSQGAILVIAVLVGAEQVGIKVTFLVIVAAAAGVALVGAVALALSLGARGYVANLIGGHYLRQAYSVGQRVRVGGFEGRILELTATAVILETPEGRASLPAKVFNDEAIVLLVAAERRVE